MNKTKFEKLAYYFTLATLFFSVIYIIIRIIYAPSWSDDPLTRTKSSYTLMLVQCILGLFAIHLPDMIEHHFKRDIPSFMTTLYIIFLYCAIYLGEVRDFYYLIPNWDTILHTFSGGMLGALGFSVVTMLNRLDVVKVDLSPLFVAMFAFCFAITLGVFWEFYEYAFDGLLGLNMQKFALEDGTLLAPRNALQDTMSDLFVDALGALVMSLVGYLSLKHDPNFLKSLIFKKIDKKKVS